MSYDSDPEPDYPSPEPSPALPLPVSVPFVTYILLGSIVAIWLLIEFTGASRGASALIQYGANFGPAILQGQSWRLFTSMFLHRDLIHLALNAYALFIFGLEMEPLYGPDRFLIIYILSGLFGSLLSFAYRGPEVLSVGASGAIFGIIGMDLAFFLLHREALGRFGRARLQNSLLIIGLNLIFGFTVPGIDNLAHIGGLLAGFGLGYGLAPRYEMVDQFPSGPRLVDNVSLLNRWWVPALALLLLTGGTSLAITFWLSQLAAR